MTSLLAVAGKWGTGAEPTVPVFNAPILYRKSDHF